VIFSPHSIINVVCCGIKTWLLCHANMYSYSICKRPHTHARTCAHTHTHMHTNARAHTHVCMLTHIPHISRVLWFNCFFCLNRNLSSGLVTESHKPMKLFVDGQVKQRKPVSVYAFTYTSVKPYAKYCGSQTYSKVPKVALLLAQEEVEND